jgi:hypothetical protein
MEQVADAADGGGEKAAMRKSYFTRATNAAQRLFSGESPHSPRPMRHPQSFPHPKLIALGTIKEKNAKGEGTSRQDQLADGYVGR